MTMTHADVVLPTISLPTASDTRDLGTRLAGVLTAGDVIVLAGPLGAGKTVLAAGIGAGLGVDGPVVSPTFVISRVHSGGRLPFVHVDAYRLGSVAELDDLDLDESLDDSVTVIEWGEGLIERLADGWLLVRLHRAADGPVASVAGDADGGYDADGGCDADPRAAAISAAGARWVARAGQLRALTSAGRP